MAASNFAKGMVIGLQVGAASAKPPVLTELTVTENGVYDQPVIGGAVEIAVGKTVTFKPHPTLDDIPAEYIVNLDKGSSVAFYKDASYNWMVIGDSNLNTIVIMGAPTSIEAATGGYPAYMNEESVPTVGAPYGITEAGWWMIYMETQTVEKLDSPPSITIETADTLGVLTDFKGFFSAPSTPADGWNKVTVNVAGDIIDVPELPTENIEEGKIYRVTTELPGVTDILIVGFDMSGGSVEIPSTLTYTELMRISAEASGNTPLAVNLIIADARPENPLPFVDAETMTQNFYVSADYPDDIYGYNSGTWIGVSAVLEGMETNKSDLPYLGVITDMSQATASRGFYALAVPGTSSTTYGIPDEANNKTVYEHTSAGGWVECKAGGDEFPLDRYFERESEEVVLPNVTKIGDNAFYADTILKKISAPVATSIGDSAFSQCYALTDIDFPKVTSFGSSAFQMCRGLVNPSLPSGLTSIGTNTFNQCEKLAITALPSAVTIINSQAFYFCRGLTAFTFPSGVQTIGQYAFEGCSNLTSVTFEGRPTFIHSTTFRNCNKLTTINVPWSEGFISGAPWGATNATINYNYTGG